MAKIFLGVKVQKHDHVKLCMGYRREELLKGQRLV